MNSHVQPVAHFVPTYEKRARLAHIGILVWDVDKMVEFYSRHFGFVVTDRGVSTMGDDVAFMSGSTIEHHQLALIPLRKPGAQTTVGQLSFVVDDLATLRSYWSNFKDAGVLFRNLKNHGNAWSVYVFDPEGNCLEIYCHSDWYVSQPVGEPLDLECSDEEILEQTRAIALADPNGMPMSEWNALMRARLGAAV